MTYPLRRDCWAGQQLWEDYGDNTDRIYLQYHGFVSQDNPFRCSAITATAPQDASGEPTRQMLSALQFKKSPPTKCVDASGESLGFPKWLYIDLVVSVGPFISVCRLYIYLYVSVGVPIYMCVLFRPDHLSSCVRHICKHSMYRRRKYWTAHGDLLRSFSHDS